MEELKFNQQFWEKQPFLEKLLFLMNSFDLSQEEAEKLAKLDFNKLEKELNNHKNIKP